jgi:hypothetical protein
MKDATSTTAGAAGAAAWGSVAALARDPSSREAQSRSVDREVIRSPFK